MLVSLCKLGNRHESRADWYLVAETIADGEHMKPSMCACLGKLGIGLLALGIQ